MIMPNERVADVRELFKKLLSKKIFTENKNKTGSKTVELINATFIADEPAIFGTPNQEWIKRESQWYHSQSLNVNDIPGGPPKIWAMVASTDGLINSNYGWAIFHGENHHQYARCREQLAHDKYSRRAIMIYTRPSMQLEYCTDGMQDFMCTNTVQYLIRDDKLISIVSMRSSDVIFGYKGDWAWQNEVQEKLRIDLLKYYPELTNGPIIWAAGSFHVYERHFHLVDGILPPS